MKKTIFLSFVFASYLFGACTMPMGENDSGTVCSEVEMALSQSLNADELNYTKLRDNLIVEYMRILNSKIEAYWRLTEILNSLHERIKRVRQGNSLNNKGVANNVKQEAELEKLKASLQNLNAETSILDAEIDTLIYAKQSAVK